MVYELLGEKETYVSHNGTDWKLLTIICVPMGTPSGPLPFIIYTDDLPGSLRCTTCMLFTDDTTVHMSDKDIKTYKLLNINIESVADIIDDNFEWYGNINNWKIKISRGLYPLNKIKHILNTNTMKIIYHSLIYPYLTYGKLLWGSCHATPVRRLEVLQKNWKLEPTRKLVIKLMPIQNPYLKSTDNIYHSPQMSHCQNP